jgi:hypothetical protein
MKFRWPPRTLKLHTKLHDIWGIISSPFNKFFLALKRRWHPELIQKTIHAFQPYSPKPLSEEDAVEILDSLDGLANYFKSSMLDPVSLKPMDLEGKRKPQNSTSEGDKNVP